MEQIFTITYIANYIILILLTLLSFIKYKQIGQNDKWYFYYIIFIFFVELFSFVLPLSYISSYTKLTSNAFLYPVYIAGEFFTVTGIFIKKLNLCRYAFAITGLVSLFFLTADRLFVQYQYNNDYSKAASNLLMISLIGYSLIQDIKNLKSKSSFQIIDKMFFLYFTVSIFIFMFLNQLIAFPIDYFYSLWIINNLMSLILYCLFIKTFLQLKK